MRILLVVVLMFVLQATGYAQTIEVVKSSRIEKIDGKKYYIHTVVKGQTLYSISKAYNVLISEIIFENQDAIDGIKPDMQLRIPFVAATTTQQADDKGKSIDISGKYRVHVVEKGQTLYAVSKLYNVSVEDIKQANPEVTEKLKRGQRLNIPVEQLIKAEEVVPPVVVKEEKTDTVVRIVKDEISAVFLLPLFLKENSRLHQDSVGGPAQVYAKSLNGLEFYEGALLAADSLSKTGVKANIYAYDIPDDEALTKILADPILKQADIIIGPFYGKKFEAVAAFAKENKIACVTPVLRNSDIAESNEYVSKVLPSDEILIRQLGEYIGRWNCKKNIIVLHNGTKDDSLLMTKVMEGIRMRCDSAKIQTLNTVAGKYVKLIDSLIVPGVENIVVSFSTDEPYVSRLVLHLEKKNSKQRNVTLFGMSEWQEFENIEVEYLQEVNLHFPVDLFADYSRPEVKSFLVKFRDKYLAEPDKYAFLGYDVTMYYLQMIKKFGRDFASNPAAIHGIGLQSNFDFKKAGQEGGLENQSTFILNYNEYRLVKVN